MSRQEHFDRLRRYYLRSRRAFDVFLGGAKHFGYHPGDHKLSERKARERMEALVAETLGLLPGMRALDAGCGQGVVSTHLAHRYGCEIDGVTVVPFEIPVAERLARRRGVADQVRYHLKDYADTGFPNGCFDAIYSVETLSHALDLGKALAEFRRLLKPGGKVAFCEYTVAERECFPAQRWSRLQWVIHNTAMHSLEAFVPARFHLALEAAGFEDVRADDITAHFEPSIAHFRRLLVIPYVFVKTLGLDEKFPNTVSIVDVSPMVSEGLVGYHLFSGVKAKRPLSESVSA